MIKLGNPIQVRTFSGIPITLTNGCSFTEITLNHNVGLIPDHIQVTTESNLEPYRHIPDLYETGNTTCRGWIMSTVGNDLNTTVLQVFRYDNTDATINLFFLGGNYVLPHA